MVEVSRRHCPLLWITTPIKSQALRVTRSHLFHDCLISVASSLSSAWSSRIWPFAIVVCLFVLAASCTWTPQVETRIESTPQGTVSLKTIAEETFRATHPIDLSDRVIKRVLQGLEKQQNIRLLQTLVSGESERTPLFIPAQVEFLTGSLKNAFAHATPEEIVYFHLTKTDFHSPSMEGSMFVDDTVLVVTWRETANKTPTKLDRSIKGESGVVASPSYLLQFSPQEAVHTGVHPQTRYLEKIKNHSVLIDYQKLETLPEHSQELIQKTHDPTPISSVPERKRSQTTESKSTHNTSPVQDLTREVHELKKQLAEQQAELERLKAKQEKSAGSPQ